MYMRGWRGELEQGYGEAAADQYPAAGTPRRGCAGVACCSVVGRA